MSTSTREGCALDYALRNHGAGLSQIPIKADGSKAPDVDSWKQYQSERATEHKLRVWLGNCVPRGIAVVGGKISGNLECIDVDATELVTPFMEVVDVALPGLLAKITHNETPRPGGHFIYRCSGAAIPGNHVLARTEPRPVVDKATGEPVIDKKTGKQKLAPQTLIETRGEGGYILVEGSPGACHPTGRTYRHAGGPALYEVRDITVEERDVLHRVARQFNLFVDEVDAEQQDRQPVHHDGVRPGDSFNLRAAWEEILGPHGWRRDKVVGKLVHWTRPDKDRGTSGTTGAVSKSGNELFCCFSTNAAPFEGANERKCYTSYTKFAAFTLLNHGGDFGAATRALCAAGYGGASTSWRSASAGLDNERPTLSRRSVVDLELFPGAPRSTVTKVIVPVDIVRNGIVIDHRRLSDATSSRKEFVDAVLGHLGDDFEQYRSDAKTATAGILIDARASWKTGSKSGDGTGDVHTILNAEVRKRVDLIYIDASGKAFDRMGGRAIGRNAFVERFTNNELLNLAATAIDAPRDDNGVLKRAAMMAALKRELELLWGDLTADLGGVETADLGTASDAAQAFRAAIMRVWTTFHVWTLNKHIVGQRDADGESVQLASRGSLAQLVRAGRYADATGARPTSDTKWRETKSGLDAWWRQVVDQCGQQTILLAMRFPLFGQLHINPPEGVNEQKSLRRLGLKYGAFEENGDVSDRLSGGGRLVMLAADLVEELLWQPMPDADRH